MIRYFAFGRIADHAWKKGTEDVARIRHGYDRLGAATIPPLWMAVFDVAVVALLVWVRTKGELRCKNLTEIASVLKKRQMIGMVAFWSLVAVSVTVWMMRFDATVLGHDECNLVGKSVTLEPLNWLGKPFPLNGSLDIAALPKHWDKGTWTVLLHQHGCLTCEELLQVLPDQPDAVLERMAIIEVPHDDTTRMPKTLQNSAGLVCSLRKSTKWFSPSPVFVTIKDGMVSDVKIGSSARDALLIKQ